MSLSLQDLGWSQHFTRQWQPDPAEPLSPARICEVHRDRLDALTPNGPLGLTLPPGLPAGEIAVGDWVLAGPDRRVGRLLDRQSLLRRRAAGTDARVQLIAANVDTLFVTTSCNADFNPARIERYLALAHEAGVFPVVLLTKADQADDPQAFVRQAEKLGPALPVLAVNALDPDDLAQVSGWCKPGQTAALTGSSGVGKTTLTNGLTGAGLATAGIREDDARGRHTTTTRSLLRMTNGGWLIDTPGMRALRLHDASEGIDALFGDIAALARCCRFSDCAHDSEPGCAVQGAIDDGRLEPARLARWRKLRSEDRRNSETLAEARARDRGFGKMIRSVQRDKKGRKGY